MHYKRDMIKSNKHNIYPFCGWIFRRDWWVNELCLMGARFNESPSRVYEDIEFCLIGICLNESDSPRDLLVKEFWRTGLRFNDSDSPRDWFENEFCLAGPRLLPSNSVFVKSDTQLCLTGNMLLTTVCSNTSDDAALFLPLKIGSMLIYVKTPLRSSNVNTNLPAWTALSWWWLAVATKMTTTGVGCCKKWSYGS